MGENFCQKLQKAYGQYVESGDLVAANSIAQDYISFCKAKKLSEEGIEFIAELKKIGISRSKYFMGAIELEIIRGNKEIVLEEIEKLVTKIESSSINLQEDLFAEIELFIYQMRKRWNFWKRESIVRKASLKLARYKITSGKLALEDLSERDSFISLAIDDLVLGLNSETIACIKEYAIKFKNKTLIYALKKQKGIDIKLSDNDLKKFDDIPKLHKLKRPSDEMDVLIRDIKFVIGIKGTKGAIEKLKKLQKIDPTHPLVIEYLDKKGSRISVPHVLKKIEAQKGEFDESDNKILYNAEESTVMLLFEDLITALITMDLPKSALTLIENRRSEIKSMSISRKVNLIYLEVICLKLVSKTFEALHLIEDAMQNFSKEGRVMEAFSEERRKILKEAGLDTMNKKIRG